MPSSHAQPRPAILFGPVEREPERPMVDAALGMKPFRRKAVRGDGVDVLVEDFAPNSLGSHRHAHWQLVMIPAGSAHDVTWRVPGAAKRSCRLVGGDVWLLPPLWIHTARWSEPNEAIVLFVHDQRVRRHFPELLPDRSSIAKLSEYAAAMPGIVELCREVRHFARSANGSTDWRVATAGAHLATSLLSAHLLLTNGVFRPPSPLVAPVIEKLLSHLTEHPGDRLRLAAISTSLGVSDRHLRRIFREYTGSSPQEWVMLRKARQAVECLLQGCNVKETVERAGFSSESHLHRIVLRIYGVSPKTFRKQAQAARPPLR